MRHLLLSALLAAGAAPAAALSVINSKHDLSAGSATTGPKTTSSDSSPCMFCHTAHRPAQRSQLWNRADSSVQFTFYSSNYLNNYLGQATPTMSDLNASKTKLCLSCHDGVTALGSLYNIAPNTLSMTGTMSASAVIGTDLSNDHPVLYDVKPGAGPPAQPGTDAEIRLPPAGDAVKVYGPTNRVECTSCHDPHDDTYGKFLVKSNANAALCTSCHQKTGWLASAHAASNAAYNPEGTPTTVGEYSCRSCHLSHGASSAQAYILRGAEENTCYDCHGSPALPGAPGIKNQFAKASKHPVESVAGVHVNPELDGANFKSGRRHSECWDCHNPHRGQPGTHASPGNAIGAALLGGWGVEPTYGAATAWQAATSYVRQAFNDTTNYKEYQLCFKCHSYYAYGITPPAGYTDQSVEYNPANRSGHPVRESANARAGAVAPKALAAAQLSAPWNAGMGNQTMTCSDCHASDVTSDPKGPHGSASQYLLKGPKRYWPKNSSGALWTLADVRNNANAWSSNLYCANCHPLYSNGKWTNNVHSQSEHRAQGVSCITCHVVVPHGARRSRLIGYASEPAPYNYNGAGTYDKLVLNGFKKASGPNGYQKSNCTSRCHSSSGTFEP
ncbi:MAG: cytochrome c3 family protein [Elusimicrobia bacterium]|nr:cytochrome c3 family protein [Elusimicrobiota bacterium]